MPVRNVDDLIVSAGRLELDGPVENSVIIVGARPGMGKTSIALNIALHAAMNEKKSVAIPSSFRVFAASLSAV